MVTPPYDVNTRARSLPGPVDDPALAERGRRALAAFRRARTAAAGDLESDVGDHFRPGRGTDLTGADERPSG